MSSVRQVVANTWTGEGNPQRFIIEINAGRVSAVQPFEQQAVRPDALVFPDDAVLIPAFHDAHAHVFIGGLQLGWCNFHGVSSTEQFSDVLTAYVHQHRGAAWIRGSGLDETRVKITRLEIDKVCPDTPVFIWSHDLHSAIVNSAALIRSRIDGSVKDPEGGHFERDALGKLAGVLRESAAHVIERTIPSVSTEEARQALMRAQEYAFSLGITAISSSARHEDIPHYLDFVASSDCKLRINLWRVSEHFDFEEDRFEMQSRTGFRYATLKGFADGALGSRTAAFFEPYAGGGTGIALVREGPLGRWIKAAHREGFQFAIHAIGDRANSICLDAIEMATAGGRGPEYRPRIEHCQHLRERDIPRFAELGVIASMQPTHCTSDMHVVEPRLGAERAARSYAWKSLLNHGAKLAFGTDWPVEDLSAIAGIHAAVTRQDASDEPPAGWQPQERISVEEAMRAYTSGSAYAAFWEEDLGTITPGEHADFAVLSKNIFTCDPKEIKHTSVLMTIANGDMVYSAMPRGSA
jgi:predicted amidohydrolase YtcJ